MAPVASDMAPSMAERLDQIWQRLDLVMDPELDEAVTDLGFVEAVSVDPDGGVDVAFRLPTYWCSPNFAFLMAEGIRREIEVLPWVAKARVQIQDHMAAAEMSAAVNAGGFFSDVFNDLTKGEDLSALRHKFDLKAFQRRQEVVIRALLAEGLDVPRVIALPLADLQARRFADPEAEKQRLRYLSLLLSKGIASAPSDLALPTCEGAALTEAGFGDYMAQLRAVRINMEFSGSMCRGLKHSRYKELVPGEDGLTLMDFLPPPGPSPHQDPAMKASHGG
jgi:metal-sulfur cluster biosynthetic enzyme